MNTEQFTPGRWAAGVCEFNGAEHFAVVPTDDNTKITALTGLVGAEDEAESIANARRIAACWNACEGMPTEDIEQYASVDRGVMRLVVLADDRRIQRDELLAALEVCHEALVRIRESGGHQTSGEIVAEAAIAKVKGGAA